MPTPFEMIGLLRSLIDGQVARVGPFYATVDVTRKCNLHCPGCRYHSPAADRRSSADDSPTHMPMALFIKFCDELRSMGTTSLTISGEGEPFTHPRILDMVSVAKSCGLVLSLFTNGTFINKETVDALIDVQLDVLKVSLWAATEKDYEKIYPLNSPKYFNQVKTSLQLISERKSQRKSMLPLVKLHQPIDRRNFGSIQAMLDIAIETGCDIISFSPFKTQNYQFASFVPSNKDTQEVCMRLKKLKKIIKKQSIAHTINTTLLRYHVGGKVWEKLPCYIGWLHVRIKPDGMLLPCNSYGIPAGNLNTDSLKTIWNQSVLRQFRKSSMTRKGLAAIAKNCDCFFCCHVADNLRVHRSFRWISPFFNRIS